MFQRRSRTTINAAYLQMIMSSTRPTRGRSRTTRNAHNFQDGANADGPNLLYSLTNPPLYPDLLWHSSGRASSAEGDLTSAIMPDASISEYTASNNLQVPLQNLKRSSVITYTLQKQDEIQRVLHQEQVLLSTTHKNKRLKILADILGDTRHFPVELLFEGIQRNSSAKKQHGTYYSPCNHTAAPLEPLEQQEEEKTVIAEVISSASAPFNATMEDEQVDDDEYLDDPDVEEELDYTQDYYASDPDSEYDAVDGEAVF